MKPKTTKKNIIPQTPQTFKTPRILAIANGFVKPTKDESTIIFAAVGMLRVSTALKTDVLSVDEKLALGGLMDDVELPTSVLTH